MPFNHILKCSVMILLGSALFILVAAHQRPNVVVRGETNPATAKHALDSSGLAITTIVSHLDVPWEIVWGPDNWIWFTEQSGTVSKVNPVTGEQKLLLRIIPDVYRNRTLGLLCMALHPDMKNHPYVFLNYTYAKGKQMELRSKHRQALAAPGSPMPTRHFPERDYHLVWFRRC